MLEVKQRTIEVIEVEDNFVFEIHNVVVENEDVVEVWLYHKDYSTKIHAFSIMKESIESPIKLYKHIEDHMNEYIDIYKEEVFED